MVNNLMALEKQADSDKTLAQMQQVSVRQMWPGTYGGVIGGDALTFFLPNADLLPSWGTYACDRALRYLHYAQFNALWGGAVKVFIEKILSTPYEISGGRNLTFQWQDIFFASDFLEGYDFMMTKFLTDYLTLNRGGFIEKVGYGDSESPLEQGAKIIGLNQLDPMRIVMTGNAEHPYIYYSEYTGAYHRMHHSRVIRLTHMPTPITTMFGMGKSALYDSLTVANAQINLGKAQNESLSDMPPAGIVVFNNIKGENIQEAMLQFEADRNRDGAHVYRAPLHLESKDPTQPATVEFIPLAQMPSDWDYEKYMKTHVNLLALTMGLDPQDIWPLSTHAMGSGAQSQILAQKTSGKGPGYLLTQLERLWNSVLPRSLQFKYKASNAQQGLETAQIALQWSQTLNPITWMSDDEKRMIMANQVEAFADALYDEQGNLIRLDDVDPKEPQDITMLDDAAQNTEDLPADQQTTAGDTEQVNTNKPTKTDTPPAETKALHIHKDYYDTSSAYVDELAAVMQDGIDRIVGKAMTASRFRGVITRFGKPAYQDGLEDGGVSGSDLDDDDLRLIADYNVWDSIYVTDIVNEIYSEAGLSGTPQDRATKWISTLNRFYYGGLTSADKNGMYEFKGTEGKRNPCGTCSSLMGVKHRMKWWVEHEMRPGIDHDSFECGTWPGSCEHYLEKVVK